ncbi:hypothetical protein HDC37_002906 [Microbacterium sp. AK009]|uniref:hypothetical protein n=1 Tax=Microbacterium sp. AK009 TaxID=2723068 RepID=UPI0015CAF4D6|nr:hypothetical protein [Microbacterium sp. AK009]NYF18050.1 hypothetical protein [Microbacterium sp. AK009]
MSIWTFQLVATEAEVGIGLAVLAGYAVIYCLPCLIILAVGLIACDRVQWHGKRSIPVAVIWILLGAAVLSVPFWLS